MVKAHLGMAGESLGQVQVTLRWCWGGLPWKEAERFFPQNRVLFPTSGHPLTWDLSAKPTKVREPLCPVGDSRGTIPERFVKHTQGITHP